MKKTLKNQQIQRLFFSSSISTFNVTKRFYFYEPRARASEAYERMAAKTKMPKTQSSGKFTRTCNANTQSLCLLRLKYICVCVNLTNGILLKKFINLSYFISCAPACTFFFFPLLMSSVKSTLQ